LLIGSGRVDLKLKVGVVGLVESDHEVAARLCNGSIAGHPSLAHHTCKRPVLAR
jgi:hypothetical protein